MSIAPLALALAIDAVFGEPPTALHPVAWIGQAIGLAERLAPRDERRRLLYGGAVAAIAPTVAGVAASELAARAPLVTAAAILKCAFAGRALLEASKRVEAALSVGEVEHARRELRALVSRSTADLDPSLACAAAVESLAENFVDSWLSPLVAYAAFGTTGLYAYRAANTADAMWGYRTVRYEALGKASARLDDLLNYLPARMGALLLVACSDDPASAWRAWRRDSGKTASPNAGQSIAAMAGGLGLRLEKIDHYVLNAGGSAPRAEDIARARRVVRRAMWLSAGITLATMRLRRKR